MEEDPLAHTLLPLQSHGRHRRGSILRQPLQSACSLGEGQSENEFFFRPGHGHIQQPHLLGHHLPLQLPGHRSAGQSGVLHHPLPVQPLGAYPQHRMEQHRAHQVLPV